MDSDETSYFESGYVKGIEWALEVISFSVTTDDAKALLTAYLENIETLNKKGLTK